MIDLSLLVNDPQMLDDIVIQRTTGGHFEKSAYTTNPPVRLTLKGILNPDTTKEIEPNELGARATGHLTALFDPSIQIYTTRDKADGNDISDVIIWDAGTDHETQYRITSVNNLKNFGLKQVDAERVGAI